MNMIIRELRETEEFYDVLKVQEAVGFAPVYGTVAPHIFKAFSMKEPLTGIVLGAYLNKDMVGYLYDFPTSLPNEHYMHGVHVVPKYQGQGIGEELMRGMREIALRRGIVSIYWTYDPLEGKNANLYLRKCGAEAIRYFKDYYKDIQGGFSDKVPNDRFLAKWDLKMVGGKKPKASLEELEVATEGSMPDDKEILLEIPQDFTGLMKNDVEKALEWRVITQKVLEEYMTRRGYKACNFIQCEKGNFYLLSAD